MSTSESPDRESLDALAKHAALARTQKFFAREPEAVVEYRSQGRVLIVGPQAAAETLANALQSPLQADILDPGAGHNRLNTAPHVWFAHGRGIRLDGHLGAYHVQVGDDEQRNDPPLPDAFDLVVDLGEKALIPSELPPFGYFRAAVDDMTDPAALAAQLRDMVGEFEKPKYFDYRTDICAHGYAGMQGCTRCLDACPAEAIISLEDLVRVDPFLCQGGGACVSACPSGAMRYTLPRAANMLDGLRKLLQSYRDQGGQDAVILFHDAEDGAERLAGLGDEVPGRVIPVPLEELASVGMEIWLSALAYGAKRIGLLDTEQVPARSRAELDRQLEVVSVLLQGLGYPGTAVMRVATGPGAWEAWVQAEDMPPIEAGSFWGEGGKRETLFFALDHLAAQVRATVDAVPLPPQSPFGTLQIDRQACTLCMACVSVCPPHALADGGTAPRLDLYESRC
ncbi:MAG: 4Fe-4S binding protein, partial [Gammaproteobacteria bacterium]